MGDVPKRLPATKVWVADVLGGRFVQAFTEFVLPDNQLAGRVALCGILINNNVKTSDAHIVIDDGTGIISLRFFEVPNNAELLVAGTPVLVIGRPRRFSDGTYILAEIIKQLPDIKWLEVWKRTVPRIKTANTIPQNEKTVRYPDKVIEIIRKYDTDKGADAEKVIKESNIHDCENIIAELLLKGVIFEVSPGRLKVLE